MEDDENESRWLRSTKCGSKRDCQKGKKQKGNKLRESKRNKGRQDSSIRLSTSMKAFTMVDHIIMTRAGTRAKENGSVVVTERRNIEIETKEPLQINTFSESEDEEKNDTDISDIISPTPKINQKISTLNVLIENPVTSTTTTTTTLTPNDENENSRNISVVNDEEVEAIEEEAMQNEHNKNNENKCNENDEMRTEEDCDKSIESQEDVNAESTKKRAPIKPMEEYEAEVKRRGIFQVQKIEIRRRMPKLYHCKICGDIFRHIAERNVHMSSIHGITGFTCEVCNEQFENDLSLKTHMYEHNKMKKKIRKCDQCNKSFIYKSHLLRHEKTHSTEKFYRCNLDTCKHFKGWKSKSDYQHHMEIHKGKTIYCTVEGCNYKGQTKKHVSNHKMYSHGPVIQCVNAGKGCDFERIDKRALNRHEVKCEFKDD